MGCSSIKKICIFEITTHILVKHCKQRPNFVSHSYSFSYSYSCQWACALSFGLKHSLITLKSALKAIIEVLMHSPFPLSLQWSAKVAAITEVPPVACLPNFIVQRKVLRPFRYQVGGTILVSEGGGRIW